MRGEIKLLHQRIGTTTIHVTHDQQEALAIADLIAVIKEGRLEQLGAPLELYNNPSNSFVASFVGDPPMSLVRARLAEDDARPVVQIAGVSDSPAGGARGAGARARARPKCILGCDPQQVVLADKSADSAIVTTVYSHEMVGREQQLMLALGPDSIRCRLQRPIDVKVGDTVRLTIVMEGAKAVRRRVRACALGSTIGTKEMTK